MPFKKSGTQLILKNKQICEMKSFVILLLHYVLAEFPAVMTVLTADSPAGTAARWRYTWWQSCTWQCRRWTSCSPYTTEHVNQHNTYRMTGISYTSKQTRSSTRNNSTTEQSDNTYIGKFLHRKPRN